MKLAVVWSALCGCGRRASDVPSGEAAGNIRQLALAYVGYAGAHGGVGPAKQEELAKFVAQRESVSEQEANARFTSPRDNKPYVIRWKQRSHGPPIGHDPPKPTLIIYEQDGLGGTRYTADGQLSIKEMSDEQISQAYPEFQKTGG
jgi:hypothetical protein